MSRLTELLQLDCKGRLQEGAVVKAIQHLYRDKEKVKLPVEMLGKRKIVAEKKERSYFSPGKIWKKKLQEKIRNFTVNLSRC